MNIQKHKSPLLKTRFATICEPFEFNFGGEIYFVSLKKGRNSKNTVYAVVSDRIVILGQYKINGLHSIPIYTNKLEVLAYSAFAHYLCCELYNV